MSRPIPALVVALALTLSAGQALAASGFTDVPEQHWAAAAVRYVAAEHAYMGAVTPGRFEGQAKMDRLAFALTLIRVLPELEVQANGSWRADKPATYDFVDVPLEHRAAVNQLANTYRCFDNMPDVFPKNFQPDAPLTRAQMAHVINVVLKRAEERKMMARDLRVPPLIFRDLSITTWGAADIDALANRYQVLGGFPDGGVQPEATLTRYQFAAAAAKIFPKVAQLIARAVATPAARPTAAATPEPALTPAETQPGVRFLEDAPLQAQALFGQAGFIGGMGRGVLYVGPLYGQLDASLRTTPNALQAISLRLGTGLPAWGRGAIQPFFSPTVYTNGSQHALLAGGGLLIQGRPSRLLGITAQAKAGLPVWSNANLLGLSSTLFYDASLGAQIYLAESFAVTVEGGYGTTPSTFATGGFTHATGINGAAGLALWF